MLGTKGGELYISHFVYLWGREGRDIEWRLGRGREGKNKYIGVAQTAQPLLRKERSNAQIYMTQILPQKSKKKKTQVIKTHKSIRSGAYKTLAFKDKTRI
jgi:hypothetical protein